MKGVPTSGCTNLAVIQARMSSERLPGKVLRRLGAHSVLSWVVRAADTAPGIDTVVVATSADSADDAIVAECDRLGVEVVRGPLDDVLSRFLVAIERFEPVSVIRLTADNPLADPEVIGHLVRSFDPILLDYMSNVLIRSLPRGYDVEIATASALRQAAEVATGPERVHVTTHLIRHPEQYSAAGLVYAPAADRYRVTLDTSGDAAALERIVDALGDGPHPWRVVVRLLDDRSDIVALNAGVVHKGVDEG